jgi:PAS domain S-box-containing protein
MKKKKADNGLYTVRGRRVLSDIIRIVVIYAVFASLWIVVSDRLVIHFLSDPAQIEFVSTLKGWVFVAVTSALLFVLLNRFSVRLSSIKSDDSSSEENVEGVPVSVPRRLVGIFLVLLLFIVAIGWLSFQSLSSSIKKKQIEELSGVAELKARQVEDWLSERMAEITDQVRSPLFAGAFERWKDSRDPRQKQLLLSRLKMHIDRGFCCIQFLDPDGKPLLSVGKDLHTRGDHFSESLLHQAAELQEPLLIDFHRAREEGALHLAFMIAMRDQGPADGLPLSLAIFTIDPSKDLFPLLQSWPRPSTSGETLLVRREGDEVVYLNELRHRKNSAMNMRVPIGRKDVPAVQGVVRGPGTYEGPDYRGIPVLATIRPVAGTTWLLVAKMDRSEVYHDILHLAVVSTVLTVAVILFSGIVIVMIWQRQRIREALALQEKEERYRSLFENMAEGFAYCRMIFEDNRPTDFIYLSVNSAFEKLTGLKNVKGKKVSEVIPGIREADPELFEIYSRVSLTGKPERFEMFVEALKMWFSISVYCPAREFFVAVFDVITDRKQAEGLLLESENKFRSLAEKSLTGIYLIQDGIFRYVNPMLAGIFGYTVDELTDKKGPQEVVFPQDWPIVKENLRRRIAGEIESTHYSFRGIKKDNEIIHVEAYGSITMYKARPAIIGTLLDITERKRADEKIQRHIHKLSALHAIDLAITSSLDIRITLESFIEHVMTQLCVDAADVLVLNPNSRMLEYAAGQGFRTDALKHTLLRLGDGYAGVAALENRIVKVRNLNEEDTRFKRLGVLEGEDFVGYYGVPLVTKGQVKGVLEIFNKSPLEPDREWLEFLDALALQAAIAIDSNSLYYDLERTNRELSLAYDSTIEGWSRALDYRDKETEGHSQRVTDLTVKIAHEMGMNEDELVQMRRGALLHDIGKLGIPDSILLKPGALTDEEWKIMRLHPVYSYELLRQIAYLRPALDIPYCHHEKWDGSGYPRGLRGEQIPLSARIFAVVDVWDALRSDRPYRPAWSEEKAKEHILSLSGIQFDPSVVETFIRAIGWGKRSISA